MEHQLEKMVRSPAATELCRRPRCPVQHSIAFALAGFTVLTGCLRAHSDPAKTTWQLPSPIASDFLVVYGKNAPAAEVDAARSIATALRTAGANEENLLDDESALLDLNRTAFHNLVLVGTYGSNVLLRQQWGHWALDREGYRDWQKTADGGFEAPFYEKAPTKGFYVFGFGTFVQPGTGLVESGRNDLSMVPLALDSPRKPGYKITVRITGVGSAGVARAADAFLRDGLFDGVLPDATEALPVTGDTLVLGRARYQTRLPAWVPREQLLGWSQADATEYGGFLQASGQEATNAWRAKYLTADGIQNFAASVDRRATSNELWVARMASPEAAMAAEDGICKTLAASPNKMNFQSVTLGGKAARQAGGFYVGVSGSWLLMESLPEPQGSQIMAKALAEAP